MSETKRKIFGGEFKAKVALEAICGIKTVNGIARDFGVHRHKPAYKRKSCKIRHSLFDTRRGSKPVDPSASSERLYSEIGRLKMEPDWLKKSGISLNLVIMRCC